MLVPTKWCPALTPVGRYGRRFAYGEYRLVIEVVLTNAGGSSAVVVGLAECGT
jgi:hypothetical protein